MGIEIMKLKHILILQNKIDLIKEAQAQEQHEQILKFIEGTVAEGAPIIPISAQLKYNIEVVCEYIMKKIPVPQRDFTSEPRLIIIKIALTTPVCTEVLEKIALSRRIDKHWRLIGWGQIRRGIPVKPTERS